MSRLRRFILRPSCLLLPLVCLLAPAHGDAPADLPDPLPLKRVWLTPDALPQALEKAKQGWLVRLPRERFEDLVRQAALAEAARKNPPKLVGAYYHAELADGALVGSCQWKVVHTAAAPGLLPLAPLTLALRRPRYENGDAYVGDFDGHDPSLLVETAGDHAVSVEWSARAEARPEGLQFDLRFPASPAAVLDIDLPPDRTAVVDGGGASGPHPAGVGGLNRWTVACGGRSQISLLVRPADRAPVVRASMRTTQTLSPDGVDATYIFALKASRQGVRDLVFECDPELRPYAVDAPGLEKWDVAAPAPNGGPVRLTARLSESLEDGAVQVRCLAPLPRPNPLPAAGGVKGPEAPAQWTSPGVRLVQSIPGGETLVLKVHPELHLADVAPGAFRLQDAGAEMDADGRTEYGRLTFVGGGASEAGRPRLMVRPHAIEFRARQVAWWRLNEPAHPTLTLQTTYDVSQGNLFQLAARLPADWEVDRVDLAPAGLLRNWGVRSENGASTLVVDLQRGLTPADVGPRKPTLTVGLAPAHAGPVLGKELPFPDPGPVGARFREGALAIGFDEQTDRLAVKTALREAAPDDEGPWGKETPALYYPYRELNGEGGAPAGTATLRGRPPQVRAQVTSEVALSAGQAVVETRLLLEAEQGSPESVDLYLSAPAAPAPSGDPWNWRAEQAGVEVRGARRLYDPEAAAGLSVLGAGDPFGATALSAARPRGECWRLTFARPLRVHEPVALRATLEARAAPGVTDVPLTAVLGATRLEGEATLHLAAGGPLQVEAFGLREASSASGQPARGDRPPASAWRTFRYNGAAVGLTLLGEPPANRPADAALLAEAAVDFAALTTYVRTDGVLEHHYVFQVSHWPQAALPLQMPAGARVLALQVDGLWSPRASAEDVQGRPVIDLPAPVQAGDAGAAGPAASHRYEIVYTTRAALGWPWVRVEAPAPSPPTPPASFRRLWRLAPDFSPLGTDRLRRAPGPGEGVAAAPLGMEDLFNAAGPPAASGARAQPWRPDALAQALLGLRGKAEQTRPLGALLVDAAAALRRQRQYFVVDAASLRDAGTGPTAPTAVKAQSADDETPPWEGLGLTAAPMSGGWVLTTRRQAAEWAEAGAWLAATTDAGRWGRDASGRFEAAAVWADAGMEDKNPLPNPGGALVRWTEWEPLAGGGDVDELVLVRRPVFEAAGWTLTAALGLAFLAAGRLLRRARLWLLLLWLAAAGLALLWLPAALQPLAWPPLLAGCLCALAWRLWSAARGVAATPPNKAPSTVVAVVACAAALSAVLGPRAADRAAAHAAPADPHAEATATTVFLVPGPDDAPDQTTVLAPPDLLDQLRALSRPGAGPAAVVVNAEYTGQVAGGAADFTAVFEVYCFTDESATAALPFDGADLTGDEVRLDGMVVKPTALSPHVGEGGAGGFTVPVMGRTKPGDKPHRLELHFRTAVTGTEEERNLQFTAPRLAQSRMTLHLPKGAAYVQAPARHGALRVGKDGPDSLEVDLGRVAGPLHVRWVPGEWLTKKPDAQVREAYLWDLGADAGNLTALLSYSIAPGGAPSLAVKLPPGLEALSVEVRRPREGPAVRLRDWRVEGDGAARTLTMEFAYPVSGDIEATLEFAPRSPWPASFELPLPSPVLPPSPQTGKPARPRASYLAYRAAGLAVERVNAVGVTGVPAEQFAPFWPASSRPDPRSLTYASTLLREDDTRPPVLGLRLRPAAPATHARVDLTVRVGARQADVHATAALTAPDGLSLAQWRLRSAQPFTVTGVSGPNVKRWGQDGDRVLVWLEPTIKGETKMELTGWAPLAEATAAKGQAPSGMMLELPNLRLAAESQETSVRLVPGDQVALAEASRAGLTPDPALVAPPDKGVLAYTAGGRGDYAGAWQVQAGPAVARIYTAVGAAQRRLAFAAVVDCEPAHGSMEALSIRVRRWAGEVKVTAPSGVRSRERRRAADDWTCALEQDAGSPGRLRIILSGEMPADAAGAAVQAPDVTVSGVGRVERWAASVGRDVTAEPALGLAPADGPAAAPAELAAACAAAVSAVLGPPRPADAAAAQDVWKIASADWRLNLAPRDLAAPQTPIEVYLAEHHAAVADGGRWLHEADFWLRHEPNTDLNLTLPADAEVLSAAIDGDEASPLQAEARRLWLPLTGRPAVCRVRIRWRYLSERFAAPNLDPPAVQGAAEGPGLWTVYAPPGWAPEPPLNTPGHAGGGRGEAALQSGLSQAAALHWQRAEALNRVSAALAQETAEGAGGAALAEAQRQFYVECRRARDALQASPENGAPAWPEGHSPAETIQELLERNKDLAAKRQFETERAKAESAAYGPAGQAGAAPAWEQDGRPLYARTIPGDAPPQLTLTREAAPSPAWAISAAWLGLLLLIGLLSLVPPVAVWARVLWPEEIAVIGLVGWWAVGSLTPVVAVLLLIAIGGRAIALAFAAGRLFRKPPTKKSKSTAPMPAAPNSGS